MFTVGLVTVTNFTDVGRFSIDFKWFAGPLCCEGGMMSGSEVAQSLPFADIVSVSAVGLEMVDVGFLQDMMYLVLLGFTLQAGVIGGVAIAETCGLVAVLMLTMNFSSP